MVLNEHVAVVAGASRGIGQGIAIELAAAGAFLYLVGRTAGARDDGRRDTLMHTLSEIERLGGRGEVVACDCTDPQQVAAVIRRVEQRHGRLDILVSSVFSTPSFAASIGKRIWEAPEDLWQAAVDVPTRSSYNLIAKSAPLLMRSAGPDRPGLIVNVAGRGVAGYRYNAAYGVGKAALVRLVRDAALELEPHQVAAIDVWPNGYAPDPSRPETPRYTGRAVAALAGEPGVMRRTGRSFWSAEIGTEYGFTDEHGHAHEVSSVVDEHSRPGVPLSLPAGAP